MQMMFWAQAGHARATFLGGLIGGNMIFAILTYFDNSFSLSLLH